jgi:Ca2+-binding RTX toxin-like protein
VPRLLPLAAVAVLAAPSAVAVAKTSHAGWPQIDGRTLINKGDADRTSTGLTDKHNKLLGGHGDDVLEAGDLGDVLWGDYKPSGQPTTQRDTIVGGPGKDFIYAGHGKNTITSGGGADQIHAHFGHGTITCSNTKPTVFLGKNAKRYVVRGCTHVTF